MSSPSNIFQFKSFNSFVHPSFWHKLAEIKIDVDHLNDGRKSINAFYTNSGVSHCLLETDCCAFNKDFEGQLLKFQCHGAIYNKNKIEDFKSCDKLALIKEEGQLIWNDIVNGKCLQRPSLLARFLVLSFADLKTYNFYYWFAYPCPCEPIFEKCNKPKSISEYLNASEFAQLSEIYFKLTDELRSFFIVQRDQGNGQLQQYVLADKIDANNKEANFANTDLNEVFFCFSDPSPNADYGGWPLRLFLLMLTHLCPQLRNTKIKILSLRVKKAVSLENSVVFTIKLPTNDVDAGRFKWIGWEPNTNGKFLPMCASMAASMDPQKLAESGVFLNLKLMKWRLLPELDLKKNSKTKCLLFGAGTLGCSVARNLIASAWGFRHISFIDSGHVSYSNPVRQSLFMHEDAMQLKEKAKTAANRLQEISPGIATAGHKLHIPMPGYTIGESLKEKTIATLTQIEELVKQHDVMFLLTDSRESRWLPTVLAAANDKIVINAALGFDSYLVMRHGCNPNVESMLGTDAVSQTITIDGFKCIRGNQLGCYFCQDITAPGDSLKGRTLDQQCTVTRPAVSNIAGSLAVELLVSLVQHPEKSHCPAYISVNNYDVKASADAMPEGLLGIIPHSIRGTISNFENILPATERFNKCIACSQKMLDEYRLNGHLFLLNAFASSKYLEDLSGISELLNAHHDEVLEFDSDFEQSD